MRLELKNIGKIDKANVELNGITVIAGENNTGKSTVSKALYAVYNSFYEMEMKVEAERRQSIANALKSIQFEPQPVIHRRLNIVLTLINNLIDVYSQHPDIESDDVANIIRNECKNLKLELSMSQDELSMISTKIHRILKIPADEIRESIIRKMLVNEFSDQVLNAYHNSPGEIHLTCDSKNIIILIDEDGGIRGKKLENTVFYSQAIYIDDLFVLDDYEGVLSGNFYIKGYLNHRTHLSSLLFQHKEDELLANEIIVNSKLKTLISKISVVCSGDVTQDNDMYYYRNAGSAVKLSISNLSTGLKTFAILKTLLQKSVLTENSILILDEPEIHLHPEWQLLFAELIILLQKEFDLKVLLNTHSPYFLRAIEVYSVKYASREKCKYYLASNIGETSVIKDASDRTEEIYSLLAKPFQTLETESSELC